MNTEDTEGKSEALAIAIYEAVNDDTSTRTPWTYLDPGEWDKWRRAANLIRNAKVIGYLAESELSRIKSGHDASMRSARFGPSALDGDIPVFLSIAAAKE